MIKIDCPSCSKPYELDELRVPPNGVRMRCPSCDTRIRVYPDGSTTSSGATSPKLPPNKPPAPPPIPSGLSGTNPLSHDEVDLPAPIATRPEEIDLPAPKLTQNDEVDLPAPIAPGRAEQDEIDLPRPKSSPRVVDSSEEIDLPMAMSDSDLPRPVDYEIDLPTPKGSEDLPVARDDFANLDLPLPKLDDPGVPPLDAGKSEAFSDDMELAIETGLLNDDLEDLEWSEESEPPDEPDVGSGMEFGELDLSPAGMSGDNDLEFADLPEAGMGGLAPAVIPGARPAPGATRPKIGKAAPKKKRAWLLPTVIAALLSLSVLGFGFFLKGTKHGLFGQYALEGILPAAGQEDEVGAAIAQAEKHALPDTFEAVRDATYKLGAMRVKAGLNRSLLTRSVVHESLFSVRFGGDAKSIRRVRRIMRELKARKGDAPQMSLAAAANALRINDLTFAASSAAEARTESPDDPYVDLVAGEIALRQAKSDEALGLFQASLKKGGGTRAQWGIARAHILRGDKDAGDEATQETLRQSPTHAAARIAAARSMMAKGEYDSAYTILEEPSGYKKADGRAQSISSTEHAEALTLVGEIDEAQGRRGAARAAYEKAALLSTNSVRAKLGSGRLLLAGGNPRDALIRFDAVLRSGAAAEVPSDASCVRTARVEATLRATEALLQLERVADARRVLKPLDTDDISDPDVALWLGRSAGKAKLNEEAVRQFTKAIKLDPKSFRGYAALAHHYVENDQASKALAVLRNAEKHVPMTARVRRLRGESALQRNRVEEAYKEFEKAIALDPNDGDAHFGLAKVYRRTLQLEKAEEQLQKVRTLDPLRIGVDVERGLISEARGDLEGAAKRYRAALDKTPENLDLRSKLGAVLVKTGQPDKGKKYLDKVLREQPYNAEAIHYLGRVALGRGKLILARQQFNKAVRLEPQNASYQMYMGWTALEANELGKASRLLNKAIQKDPLLAKAYWLRAKLRLRTGAARDALKDLIQSIKLDPADADAYATLARSFEQLTEGKHAIDAYRQAVQLDSSQALWWYRLARLEMNEGLRDKSLVDAKRSIELGSKSEGAKPGWLADAHRLAGELHDKLNQKEQAVHHYSQFWKLATMDHVERALVYKRLSLLGSPPDKVYP